MILTDPHKPPKVHGPQIKDSTLETPWSRTVFYSRCILTIFLTSIVFFVRISFYVTTSSFHVQ